MKPLVVALVLILLANPAFAQGSEYPEDLDLSAGQVEAGPVDHTWTFVLAGFTAAAAITGGVLLGVAHDRQDQLISDLQKTDTAGAVVGVSQVDANRIDQDNHDLQTGAFVAFGVAASAAIGTLVVALTATPTIVPREEDDDDLYEVRLIPDLRAAPTAHGGVVSASWSF